MSASAAKAEALKTETSFDYDGVTYTLAPSAEWDLDVLDAFEGGQIATAVRLLLGDDQWATFRSKPRKVRDLNELFAAVQKAAGLGN